VKDNKYRKERSPEAAIFLAAFEISEQPQTLSDDRIVIARLAI